MHDWSLEGEFFTKEVVMLHYKITRIRLETELGFRAPNKGTAHFLRRIYTLNEAIKDIHWMNEALQHHRHNLAYRYDIIEDVRKARAHLNLKDAEFQNVRVGM